MDKSSNFFTFHELINTQTGLDNIPTQMSHVENLVCLADLLNELRYELQAPIYVNSAFRTPQVNVAVGGATRSLHLSGRAADIRAKNMERLTEIVLSIQDRLTEVIIYPTFIHIAI